MILRLLSCWSGWLLLFVVRLFMMVFLDFLCRCLVRWL